ANAFLNEENVQDAFDKYPQAGVLLVQLEIPMETVEAAITYARSKQITVILNPAPMNAAVSNFLDKIDIITPNAHEAEALSNHPITDVDSAVVAAKKIQALGVRTVIITLGEEGAILLTGEDVQHIEAAKVEAVDSTADRKSTRLNSSHVKISYAVLCLKKKSRATHTRAWQ